MFNSNVKLYELIYNINARMCNSLLAISQRRNNQFTNNTEAVNLLAAVLGLL